MISAEGVKRYCAAMYAAGVEYVWGADVEVITEELLAEKRARFGTGHYKDVVLCDVEGKLGADCSGFLTPIAGIDRTAESHYKTCAVKGKAADLPVGKVCLIFRMENDKIVHVAVYVGDGSLYEMWNGCVHRRYKQSEWTYYGIPAWIEEQSADKLLVAGDKVTVAKQLTGHITAAEAMAQRNAKGYVLPGTYYVYKVYGKAINVTKKQGCPGSWVVL